MKEQTGDSYTSSAHAKALFVQEAKVGKTVFLIAQSLGVFPGQKYGGVITSPQHLHVISVDSDAVGGAKSFIQDSCGATPEALKFRVYNMEDDARRAFDSDTAYTPAFFLELQKTLDVIRNRVSREKGVHVVLVSSLTGIAAPLERELMGPPGGGLAAMEAAVANPGAAKKGYGDQDKWQRFKALINETRNIFQLDDWHCFWEAHIEKKPIAVNGQWGGTATKEALQISGSAGSAFPYNVSQIFKLKRKFGQKIGKTKVDITTLDTRPSLDFVANGRNFTERLDPEEGDLTKVFHKLGLRIGRWGFKKGSGAEAEP